MQKWILISGVLLSSVAMSAGAEQHNMAGMEMHTKAEQASHHGKGKVVSVDSAKLSIKLTHEPIKSLGWSGMTMDFRVENAALLEGLKKGDAVTFELVKGKKAGTWLITSIKH